MPKPKHPKTLDFLLANICHLHHSRARQLFQAIGLHRGQPQVLLALWEQEGLTQTELAGRLEIKPATVTKMLQRMEKAGFIERKADVLDQRVSRVHLTPTGRAIQRDVEAVWRTMQAETFANFTLAEQAALRRFLLQMLENLQRVRGEQVETDRL